MLDRRIHRRRPIRSKRSPPPLTNNRRAALLAPLIVVVVEATQNDADGSHRWSQLRPSSSSSFFSFPTASHRQQQQLDNRKIRKLFTFLPHAIKMAPDVDKFPFKKWKTKQKQKKRFTAQMFPSLKDNTETLPDTLPNGKRHTTHNWTMQHNSFRTCLLVGGGWMNVESVDPERSPKGVEKETHSTRHTHTHYTQIDETTMTDRRNDWRVFSSIFQKMFSKYSKE